MYATQYPPLNEDERARFNSADTGAAERARLYGRDMLATASAYACAADAVGLRRDCSRYLFAESVRLHTEGQAWLSRADELDQMLAR